MSATQRESPIRRGPTIENLVQPVTPDTTFVVPSMFPGPTLNAEGDTTYYVITYMLRNFCNVTCLTIYFVIIYQFEEY